MLSWTLLCVHMQNHLVVLDAHAILMSFVRVDQGSQAHLGDIEELDPRLSGGCLSSLWGPQMVLDMKSAGAAVG